MSKIINFYLGLEPNQDGHRITKILTYDHERLEASHSYIQWIFPLTDPSRAVPGSPVLTGANLKEWAANPICSQIMLEKSLPLMLDFYGLKLTKDKTIILANNFNERSHCWITPGDHNHLRLTRMMKSMNLLGLGEYARALQAALLDIAKVYPKAFLKKTVEIWESCV